MALVADQRLRVLTRTLPAGSYVVHAEANLGHGDVTDTTITCYVANTDDTTDVAGTYYELILPGASAQTVIYAATGAIALPAGGAVHLACQTSSSSVAVQFAALTAIRVGEIVR